MASEPISVFFSYSRKDQVLMEDLMGHLEPLRRSQLIRSWYDGCIGPGEEWEPQIKENLEQAQIILLLVSVDFINSDYCYTVELSRAIARHKAGEACVIPVILRSCLWNQVPVGDLRLGDLQALPKDTRPISQWSDRDEAYTSIAEGLYDKIQQLRQEQEQAAHGANLVQYRQAFTEAVHASYPLSQAVLTQLQAFQQRLGLQDRDVARVEHPVREPAEARYREALAEAERQRRAEDKAQRQRQEAERQRQRNDYFSGGLYHFSQGNYDQAIADFAQAEELGHPEAKERLAKAQRQKQANEDDLSSEKEIDYTRLRDLLKAQDWYAADEETYEVMIRAVAKNSNRWFSIDELLNFPCTDLRTIDCLWVKYSQGKFGFSVQKKIYVECGAKLNGKYPGKKIWYKLCDRVGWRKAGYHGATFSDLQANHLLSPAGEFPICIARTSNFCPLISRLVNCSG